MQKAVLKLDLHGEKDKKKAMKIVSGFAGVDSIDVNMKDNKLTVTGAIDAVELVGRLRKVFSVDILSVGPAKEAQKKDDNKKDGQDKKDDNKSNKNEQSKDPKFYPAGGYPFPYGYIQPLPPPAAPYFYGRNVSAPPPLYFYGRNMSVEEDPNGCVIC